MFLNYFRGVPSPPYSPSILCAYILVLCFYFCVEFSLARKLNSLWQISRRSPEFKVIKNLHKKFLSMILINCKWFTSSFFLFIVVVVVTANTRKFANWKLLSILIVLARQRLPKWRIAWLSRWKCKTFHLITSYFRLFPRTPQKVSRSEQCDFMAFAIVIASHRPRTSFFRVVKAFRAVIRTSFIVPK